MRKLKSRAKKVVGAPASHRRHDAAAPPFIFGALVVRFKAEFLGRIGIRVRLADVCGVLLIESGVKVKIYSVAATNSIYAPTSSTMFIVTA